MHVPSGEIDEWAQIPLDILPNNLRNSVWYRAQMDPNYSEIIPKSRKRSSADHDAIRALGGRESMCDSSLNIFHFSL